MKSALIETEGQFWVFLSFLPLFAPFCSISLANLSINNIMKENMAKTEKSGREAGPLVK